MPGARSVKTTVRAAYLAGLERIVVSQDADAAGATFVAEVAALAYAADVPDVRVLNMPAGCKDLNDWFRRCGSRERFRAEVREAVKASPRCDPAAASPAADHDVVDPWPAPLSEAAYHGIFGETVLAIEPHTEADPAALLLQMLTMFGNAIGRPPYWRAEADQHHTNLFTVMVGRTSKGRKGVSGGHSRRIFAEVDADWDKLCVASGLSSGEGLIWAVRDPIEKTQPVKDKGRVSDYQTIIEDQGVSDKRLLVIEPEFSSTLRVLNREGNTLSALIRQAWDGHDLRALTKNSPARSTSPHISIIGHITRDELRRYLDRTEAANGFGNRFLWCCVRRSKQLPDGGGQVDLHPYVDRLSAAVRHARGVSEMQRDEKAATLWRDVYGQLSAGRPGLLGAVTGRAEAQVMRIASLYALGDESSDIQLVHLQAALEVWRYCFDSAAYIFGDALGDAKADTLLAALKKAGAAGLARSEITADVFQGNVSGRELARLLGLLQESELVTFRKGEPPGRPEERWFYRLRTYERNERTPGGDTSFVSFVSSPRPEGTSFVSFVASSSEPLSTGAPPTPSVPEADPATGNRERVEL